jgi:hypothetical protein
MRRCAIIHCVALSLDSETRLFSVLTRLLAIPMQNLKNWR